MQKYFLRIRAPQKEKKIDLAKNKHKVGDLRPHQVGLDVSLFNLACFVLRKFSFDCQFEDSRVEERDRTH